MPPAATPRPFPSLASRVAVAIVAALAVVVSLASCAEASGNRYHVALTGSDAHPGTESQPFRTIAKGLATLRPGDTLVVGGGTYPERIRSVAVAAGSSDAPINVVAAPGERPVIEGLLWLKGASWWTVSGINVTWSAANDANEHMVKFTDGHHWRFTDAEVWGARSFAGILVAGQPSEWSLDHLYVHDTAATNGLNQDHLIYVNAGTGAGVIERNLLVGSPNGRAVKIGPPDPVGPPVENLTVRYNTMIDNAGPSNVQVAWTAANNTIHGNLMVRPGAGRSAVTAYELAGARNVVRDNLVWEAARVLDVSVAGLVDGGGNRIADPGLTGSGDAIRATNSVASAYGRDAAGPGIPTDVGAGAAAPTTPVADAVVVAAAPAPGPAPVPAPAPVHEVAPATAPPPVRSAGYRMVATDGGIFAFGDAPFFGSTGDLRLNKPIVGMASTPSGNGYWLVASDGGIFSFGDAEFFGSTGDIRLNQPVVGMAATPTGRGYWLVASDGGIFAFGDAEFLGSTGDLRLNRPIRAMVATASSRGYWMVASDGGMFALGDAEYFGSTGDRALPAEIVGMAPSPGARGYWLADGNGGVYAFGAAPHLGSAAAAARGSVAGIASDGEGYWLAGRDGSLFAFGAAPALGSMAGTALSRPIVGLARA